MTVEPDAEAGRANRSALSAFHRVNSILPDDHNLEFVKPGTSVAEALQLMREQGLSHLPVVEGEQVIGVFSYRSFALRAAQLRTLKLDDVDVDEFMDDLPFIRVTDQLEVLFEHLDRDGVVLVGDPDRLVAVATPADLRRYLYRITHAFVLIEEIELALRELVSAAVTDKELPDCIRRALAHRYQGNDALVPTELAKLTISDLVQTVVNTSNYESAFSRVLGRSRESAQGRLTPIPELRNAIVHFRREITPAELETLENTRKWLMHKASIVEARSRS